MLGEVLGMEKAPSSLMIGNDYETAEEAIEVWNRRAQE